jgi:hypothetical protein
MVVIASLAPEWLEAIQGIELFVGSGLLRAGKPALAMTRGA